ncbi:MAG: DUF2089 domain-containing protein [Actinobacteria bacterium]|nr:DUF2089 domain-containing protein [Actinomycetota bacterium]MBU1944254.1 DUF2089 domain-containing protein [Actinomycetota bacterium]MBU2688005.1 DUF2089 domain-containing protein [Actinomycetota bacterium]
MEIPTPDSCRICGGKTTITKLECSECGCSLEGDFTLPRLARLEPEEQRFVELMILMSGNMKNVAAELGISYPTVRNKLDRVIEALDALVKEDKEKRERLIDDVEKGKISASLAARLLEEP